MRTCIIKKATYQAYRLLPEVVKAEVVRACGEYLIYATFLFVYFFTPRVKENGALGLGDVDKPEL